MKFPVDASKAKTVKTLELPGFQIVREGNHVSMRRINSDGSITPLTIPNHEKIKSSTLRTICTQGKITREDFLRAFLRA